LTLALAVYSGLVLIPFMVVGFVIAYDFLIALK
jgi:hypothetical protein